MVYLFYLPTSIHLWCPSNHRFFLTFHFFISNSWVLVQAFAEWSCEWLTRIVSTVPCHITPLILSGLPICALEVWFSFLLIANNRSNHHMDWGTYLFLGVPSVLPGDHNPTWILSTLLCCMCPLFLLVTGFVSLSIRGCYCYHWISGWTYWCVHFITSAFPGGN